MPEITGKLVEKYDTTTHGSSGFEKREYVIMYADYPQYPEYVKFELTQAKCQILDEFNIGDEIEVTYKPKGRKWINPKGEAVYFNALSSWKIELIKPSGSGSNTPNDPSPSEQDMVDEVPDLPF